MNPSGLMGPLRGSVWVYCHRPSETARFTCHDSGGVSGVSEDIIQEQACEWNGRDWAEYGMQ